MPWMRLGSVVVILVCGGPVWAGVYNPAELDEGPLDEVYVGKFGTTLKFLASIGAPQVEVDSPIRRRYFFQERMYDQLDPAKLSVEQKLHFSSVLIRRRRPGDAIGLLLPATRQHPDVFLLQSNLATAYDMNGDKTKAREIMTDCLETWPKEWHQLTNAQREFHMHLGWNEGVFAFYREVEMSYLKLLRLRTREPKEAAAQFEAVDALFGDDKGAVKFVNEASEFEPGKIAKAERAKLPRNAQPIVQQLLVWQPYDLRLQWLLGEILNAKGSPSDIKAARFIFDDLVFNEKVRAKELMARRLTLNNWVEPVQEARRDDDDGNQVMNWRALAISFAVGMMVAVFGHWQIREIRRRRQTTSTTGA